MEASLGSLQNPDIRSVLSACEPELQELMRQIDIMISQQKRQWEAEMQALQLRVKRGEDELLASRNLTEGRDLEIRSLREQLEGVQPGRQELVTKYEQQLQRVREELDKLKRSYHKLQRKQLKESTAGNAKETECSEVTRLTEKIEEYHQLAVQWEQQRIQHQKQLTALQAQNKSLTVELTQMKAQWGLLAKDREHRGCCLEVQRLCAQLEEAQGNLHAQELELERLRALETRLGQYRRDQQLLPEDRRKLLDSQDTFGPQASLEHQRLCNEAARLNQVLRAKDQVIHSLEACLAARGCAGVETLRQDLEKTAAKLHCVQTCEVLLKAEVACLKERLENQQRAEQTKMEELRHFKADYDSSVAEAKKLSEELQRAKQTHNGEVDGMRKEVSKLTAELHQRDITITTLRGSWVSVRRQLCGEVERGELKVSQAQLEHLQCENQRLKAVLQRLESQSPQRCGTSLASLKESYVSSLSGLEEENQQLRQMIAQTCARREESDQTRRDKYERALLSHAVADPPQSAQDSNADTRHLKHSEKVTTHSEGEIQRLFKQLHTTPPPPGDVSCTTAQDGWPHPSAPSTSSSSSSTRRTRRNSVPNSGDSSPDDCGGNNSPCPAPVECLSVSPAERMVSRFLEEENLRSTQLLQRLDRHIQGMMDNNAQTVSKYVPGGSGPESLRQ